MKIPKPLLTVLLLFLCFASGAQVQWYQNQDGHNPPPDGTIATSIQSLTLNSFIACYQWTTSNDQNSWKISKTHINGTEQRSFFITGPSAQVEIRAGHHNSMYAFERSFPLGQNAQYTIYKLDTNLNVKAQRTIELPNSFNIFNMNAFELDNSDNVYFAGDGQYPDPAGFGFNPASFVLKTDRNLIIQWRRMDSTQTSFTRLHIDRWGSVLVLADFYTFFPDIHITRITPNGQHANTITLHTDAGRFSLFSILDDDDNLLLYGGKFVGDAAQAMFLYKISHATGRMIYSKTYFTSAGSQLNDLKLDRQGNIFTLVSQYFGPGNQAAVISRINPSNGNIYWNRSFSYAHDSCNLFKLVMNESDRLYVVGEKKYHTIFSKGFALRIKKNGQTDVNYAGPDSVAFQRSHWLMDGITDRNNQLIAIGGTDDVDTITLTSTYGRAFAVRFAGDKNFFCNTNAPNVVIAQEAMETGETGLTNKVVIYPNPAMSQLNITNLDPEEYDQLVLYNMHGEQVGQQSINSTAARMDVTKLPGGMYLLVLKSGALKQEKSYKCIIRH